MENWGVGREPIWAQRGFNIALYLANYEREGRTGWVGGGGGYGSGGWGREIDMEDWIGASGLDLVWQSPLSSVFFSLPFLLSWNQCSWVVFYFINQKWLLCINLWEEFIMDSFTQSLSTNYTVQLPVGWYSRWDRKIRKVKVEESLHRYGLECSVSLLLCTCWGNCVQKILEPRD